MEQGTKAIISIILVLALVLLLPSHSSVQHDDRSFTQAKSINQSINVDSSYLIPYSILSIVYNLGRDSTRGGESAELLSR